MLKERTIHISEAAWKWLWVAAVWVAMLALVASMRGYCRSSVAEEFSCFALTTAADAALLTLPLIWLPARWRWTLWPAVSLLTIFVFVNRLYFGFFSTFMPYTTMFWWSNVNGMVIDSAIQGLRWTDVFFLLPVAMLIVLWFTIFRSKLRGGWSFRRVARLRVSLGALALWCVGQMLNSAAYFVSYVAPDGVEPSPATLFRSAALKFEGERLDRVRYLQYNGLVGYALWNLRDFSPSHRLTAGERARIQSFIAEQKRLDASRPLPQELVGDSTRRPNLLLVMVESFESWPIDMRIDDRPVMPVLDSLIHHAPGTLYWPNLASQISVGTSSDGHLMTISGLLPLRDYAAAVDFADNVYPTIFQAFRQKGYHTFEVTCDNPGMWNQANIAKAWGFDDYRSENDVLGKEYVYWSQRDKYWADYLVSYLPKLPQPWAGMAVTLSLHSPYRGNKGINPLIDNAGLHPEAANYLKMCALDDKYIARVLDALRSTGLYDNTIIAITGDHMAFGLAGDKRPASVPGGGWRIPLLVLNAPLASQRYDAPGAQIDIYPTLLDLCGLADYGWRGVGLSLLRHGGSGSVNRADDATAVPGPAELKRQREAWEVSRLILTGNYFHY